MKNALRIVYFILVAVGALLVHLRAQRVFEYAAERDLPRGHRVLASDLRTPDLRWALAPALVDKSEFVGRYLDRGIGTGQPMKPEYVKDLPVTIPTHGMETFAWWLRDSDRHWTQILDVGWRVDLCADECPVVDAPVLAVECATREGDVCAVVLQVTPEQRKALSGYRGKQKLNLVVNSADFGGTE